MKVRLIFTAVLLLVLCFVIALISCAGETDVSASVDLDAEGTPVSEDLYGLFLEDISFAGDGGLVSELVNNKSFEYEYDKTAYWRFLALFRPFRDGEHGRRLEREKSLLSERERERRRQLAQLRLCGVFRRHDGQL